MSNDTEVNFHDEFVKLTDAMKAVTETDIKLNAPICKYVDAYNRTIRSKHEELFVKIFEENYASILTESERGTWLNNKEKEERHQEERHQEMKVWMIYQYTSLRILTRS